MTISIKTNVEFVQEYYCRFPHRVNFPIDGVWFKNEDDNESIITKNFRWLNENISAEYDLWICLFSAFSVEFYFKNEEDAVMFALTWS